MKWIIVAGATGRFGQEICARLLDAGYGVLGICRDLNTVYKAVNNRFKSRRWRIGMFDIRKLEEVKIYFFSVKGLEIIGLVNAVRFVPSSLDHDELVKTFETNVLGLQYLVQEFRNSIVGDNAAVPIVDIADDGWHTEILEYRAAMRARRQLAKDLINLCHLRLKTVVRFPNDTPEQIAEYAGDAIFGMFKDVVGELTPSHARMSV